MDDFPRCLGASQISDTSLILLPYVSSQSYILTKTLSSDALQSQIFTTFWYQRQPARQTNISLSFIYFGQNLSFSVEEVTDTTFAVIHIS